MGWMDGGTVGISGSAGTGAGGPTPDAVEVVAQRLWDIAEQMASIRVGMGAVGAWGWRSPAADAFRERLAAGTSALAGAEQDVRMAALAAMAYVKYLELAAAGLSATGPLSGLPPGPGVAVPTVG
ncbi:MAG: hypothetical protein WBX27_13465 [Specibacter sp.]